jgi:hypothetical protein
MKQKNLEQLKEKITGKEGPETDFNLNRIIDKP